MIDMTEQLEVAGVDLLKYPYGNPIMVTYGTSAD